MGHAEFFSPLSCLLMCVYACMWALVARQPGITIFTICSCILACSLLGGIAVWMCEQYLPGWEGLAINLFGVIWEFPSPIISFDGFLNLAMLSLHLVLIPVFLILCWEWVLSVLNRFLVWGVLTLTVVGAVFCGVFWQQWDTGCVSVIAVLNTPLIMACAICATLLCLLGIISCIRKPYFALAWPLLTALPILFWLMAGALHFRWEALTGVGWCLGAFIVVVLPLLKTGGRLVPPPAPDRIGRRLLYRRMGTRIRHMLSTFGNRGVSVVVCGPWGSGKSHFINYLAYTLQRQYRGKEPFMADAYKGRFTICSVDIWRSRDTDAMWKDIATSLACAVAGRNVRLYNVWRDGLINVLQMLRFPAVSLADSILQVVTTGVEGAYSGERQLEARINFPRHAYVLVLDNLDRCDKQRLDALFPIIERLKRIRGLVTICAIAQEEVEKQSGNEFTPVSRLSETLIKVFDLQLPLPQIMPDASQLFLRELVHDQKIACPNLMAWIETQQLVFDTPRQIENIIRQLSVIDNCYLTSVYGEESVYKDEMRLCNAVFYLSALRISFPLVAGTLERHENPKSLLDSTVKAFSQIPGQPLSSRYLLPEEWGFGAKAVADSLLLRSLLIALQQCDEESLQYALKQEYLKMKALSDDECTLVIRRSEQRNQNPRWSLLDVFPSEFSYAEEWVLYRRVWNYAHEHAAENAMTVRYLRRCVYYNILSAQSRYAAWRKSPEILLQLMETYLGLCASEQKHTSCEILETPLSAIVAVVSGDVLEKVINCIYAPYEETSEPASPRTKKKNPWRTVRLFAESDSEKDGEDVSYALRCSQAMWENIVYHYAQASCADISSVAASLCCLGGQCFRIAGQKKLRKAWRRGVDDYIKHHRPKKSESVTRLEGEARHLLMALIHCGVEVQPSSVLPHLCCEEWVYMWNEVYAAGGFCREHLPEKLLREAIQSVKRELSQPIDVIKGSGESFSSAQVAEHRRSLETLLVQLYIISFPF